MVHAMVERSLPAAKGRVSHSAFFCVLVLLLELALTSVANAAITGQWSYGGVNYSSQAAAVAAMQAVSPQNALLTVPAGAVDMGSGSVKYKYVAPSPFPPTDTTLYQGGSGPAFTNESDALTYALQTFFPNQYQNQCGSASTSGHGWVYSANLGGPSYTPGYRQYYDVTWWNYYQFGNPQCQQTVSQSELVVTKWESYSCHAYYTHVSNGSADPGYCIDTDSDYIYYRPLVPPRCNDQPPHKSQSPVCGDPIDTSAGDFWETETDYGGPLLSFRRHYHSATLERFHGLGVGWTHEYAARIVFGSNGPAGLLRPDGHQDPVVQMSTSYLYETLSGDGLHLTTYANGAEWVVINPNGAMEIYDASGTLIQLINTASQVTTLNYTNGLLSSVVGPFGHTLQFLYNADNLIGQVTDPAGNVVTYAYDSQDNLVSVQYQDGRTRTYQYSNPAFPNNLTGITDENAVVQTTATYDDSGRVTSSQNAGGANATSVVYGATSATVVDSLSSTTILSFATPSGYPPVVNSVAQNGLTRTYTVPSPTTDAQQRATQITDERGNVTTYTYDEAHLTAKTEAYGTPQARTTSYQYLWIGHALPTLITEPLKTTAYTYAPNTANVLSKTVTDTSVSPQVSRTWSYTYDNSGLLLTVNGPRTDVSDVTTYTYYSCTTGVQCGQVQTITDAVGNITTYNSYNAHGQPLTITDPNGIVTTLAYDSRQRLTSRSTAGETTQFSYYPTGLLQTVTLPDGAALTYSYDGAHRLTQISDTLGNKVVYTLDAMGNRVASSSYDPSNALHLTHTRVYNSLNQLYQDINAANTAAVTTSYGYDSYGNQTSATAPLARSTSELYDALNRLKQITDPANGVTQFSFDANDNLVSVKDPRSLTTSYSYNGFGDLVSQLSPDTGTTTNTYDSAGNLATATDARGAVATYGYDALNRVTSVAYSRDGTTDQTISFTYDLGTNGKGHLTGASDANHSLSWGFDALGRVTSKSQTVAGITKSVAYAYTAGDLTSLTTPSGQQVTYAYNSNHQVTSISVNGTTVLTGVTYEPLGPVNGWTWGNFTSASRVYDGDGNVTQISDNGLRTLSYDDAARITGITDTAAGSDWSYGYDLLDRLTTAGNGPVTRGWTYDANGNRLTETGSSPSTYSISPASNQITGITGALARTYGYDSAGHTTGYASMTATYNDAGRLKTVANGSVTETMVYNALGQRIETSGGAAGTVLYWYDEQGHLLGEYDGSGNLIEETVWLGDAPVATLRPSGSSVAIYYVHTDQLNTPRQVTRPSDNAQVWTWFSDPFGTDAANSNPAGLGTFAYDLRFPGQVFDGQVGLHLNYFRDYDPALGRYVESDPIGLAGGINTYTYVLSKPLSYRDPTGLSPWGGLGGDISWQEAQTLSVTQSVAARSPLPGIPLPNGSVSVTIPTGAFSRVPTVLSFRLKQSDAGGSCTIGWGPGVGKGISMRYSDTVYNQSFGDTRGWGVTSSYSLPFISNVVGASGSYTYYFNGAYSMSGGPATVGGQPSGSVTLGYTAIW